MRRILIGLLCTITIFSCKNSSNQLLLGTWHSVKIDNPDIDNFFINSQKYIDTIGKANDDATNIALYGVANMDSMRKMLQIQFDSAKLIQQMADTQTLFKFSKDSVVSLVFPDRTESGKWYYDASGMLILEGATPDGGTETSKVQVVKLTQDSLRLKFVKLDADAADTSYVTFRREGK